MINDNIDTSGWSNEDYVSYATSNGNKLYFVESYDLEEKKAVVVEVFNSKNKFEHNLTEDQLELLKHSAEEEIEEMMITISKEDIK